MSKKEKLTGIIRTNSKGMGFFPRGDKFIIIEKDFLNTALDFDEVAVEVIGKNKWKEEVGKVVEIIKRANTEFVFDVEKDKKDGLKFIPVSSRFYPKVRVLNLDDFSEKELEGTKVILKLKKWKKHNLGPMMKIEKIIGKIGDNETEMLAAVYAVGMKTTFSAEVEAAAKKLKEKSGEMIENDLPNRRDLRDWNIFTIDPADAKDFDDALSARKLENGNYQIGVHIADPSFFVKPNDIIDKEAKKRGTSIYLVDRTIPMLPEVLSNDLCSINEAEDKMAFSSIFEMTEEGEVISEWYGKTVINSKKRYNYLEAQETLDKQDGPMLESLNILSKIAKKLHDKRFKNGSIEFNSFEPKFKLDENKFPIEIYIKPRTWTMEIIEEFMLLDNEMVSKFVSLKNGKKTKNPFIYRIHEKPKEEKVKETINYLEKIGYEVDFNGDGKLSAYEINKTMEKFKDTPEESIVSLTMLRTMEKARYSAEPKGHFGLGFAYYTHFTSPIRRYPDFIAHRLMKRYLDGEEIPASELKKIAEDAKHASEMEVRAVEAERASIAFKYAQYYSKRIGEEFNGYITGIKKFGVFVENSKTRAQGLIAVEDLGDDMWQYNPENETLEGKNTKIVFALGKNIKTKVKKVDLRMKVIDLELVELLEKEKEE